MKLAVAIALLFVCAACSHMPKEPTTQKKAIALFKDLGFDVTGSGRVNSIDINRKEICPLYGAYSLNYEDGAVTGPDCRNLADYTRRYLDCTQTERAKDEREKLVRIYAHFRNDNRKASETLATSLKSQCLGEAVK